MHGRIASRALAVVSLFAALAGTAWAQRSVSPAANLERLGRTEEAAAAYRQMLVADSLSVVALLGLERTLARLGRLPELVAPVKRAARAAPRTAAIRALELRVWAALGQQDSVVAAAERWARTVPGEETPYREWSRAHLARGDLLAARRAIETGRQALGGPPALAVDAAQIAAQLGDWEPAADEWRVALQREPALLAAAEASLGHTPAAERTMVIRLLAAGGHTAGARLAGHLLIGWGEAERGWAIFSRALPADPSTRVRWLRAFADRLRIERSHEAGRVLGFALEELATLSAPADARRYLRQAARAYGMAGETAAAWRVVARLDRLGGRSGEELEATLIALLADEGRIVDADSLFRRARYRLPGSERDELLDRIVWAWLAEGRLDRALSALGPDSSVVALELRAWAALIVGDLAGATELFRAAGPLADSRATLRTQVLALTQQIARDTFPELGAAFLSLVRGDTMAAARQFRDAGERLPRDGGGVDLIVFAADLDVARGESQLAEATYRRALRIHGEGAAYSAAELGLARLLISRGERAEAVELLEHLILDHPKSALVPQARQELDRARGAVPSRS
jgi:tetratricopeptide (TPR) repeat protein